MLVASMAWQSFHLMDDIIRSVARAIPGLDNQQSNSVLAFYMISWKHVGEAQYIEYCG